MARVGGLKFRDKAGKQPSVPGFVGRAVMSGQIPAAAAKHRAHRCRRQIREGGMAAALPQENADLAGGQEDARVEGIDEEGHMLFVTADQKMPRQCDRLQLQPDISATSR